jgi:hypothetical protein
VFIQEKEPLVVGYDHLINAVTELKAAVLNGNVGSVNGAKRSVDVSKFRNG